MILKEGRLKFSQLTSTKKKKCLKDSEELSVVNPSWYLNYITPKEHHKSCKDTFATICTSQNFFSLTGKYTHPH